MNIFEITIRKDSHNFTIMVTDKGGLTYTIDDSFPKHAKTVKDRKLFFIGTQEVVVRGELHEWKSMELPEKDYKAIVEVLKQVKHTVDEEQSMARLKREDKGEILKRVDKWKKRVRHYYKERHGKRLAYAIHEFTIGAQSYRFYERRIDSPISWDGIIINPVYKVDRDLSGIGAVPVRKGELTFWYYYTNIEDDDDGWKNIRELTLNELICVEIIHSYGMVMEGKI